MTFQAQYEGARNFTENSLAAVSIILNFVMNNVIAFATDNREANRGSLQSMSVPEELNPVHLQSFQQTLSLELLGLDCC